MNANSSTPLKPSPAKPTTTSSAASSVGNPDFAQCDDNQSNDEGSESDFLGGGGLSTSLPPNLTATPVGPQENNPLSATNFMNMEHSEALHHLEKALSACEATLTETPGMVKMEPDEHQMMQHHEKPYSISAVPSSNCAPGSPFPAIEGNYFPLFVALSNESSGAKYAPLRSIYMEPSFPFMHRISPRN